MKKAVLQLEPLTCPSCLQKINNAIKKVDGVNDESVNVMFNASKVKFEFDEEKISVDLVKKAIEDVGYDVLKSSVK